MNQWWLLVSPAPDWLVWPVHPPQRISLTQTLSLTKATFSVVLKLTSSADATWTQTLWFLHETPMIKALFHFKIFILNLNKDSIISERQSLLKAFTLPVKVWWFMKNVWSFDVVTSLILFFFLQFRSLLSDRKKIFLQLHNKNTHT